MKFRHWIDTVLIDPRKLTEYCLSLENPKGKDKALMFQKHLGYTPENHKGLMEQIKSQVLDAEAIPQWSDKYGQRFQVDLEIQGIHPSQRETVRTGWIVPLNSRKARLVTAYIRGKS